MAAPFGDYLLSSCEVDCELREVRLRASRPFDGEPKFTELVFRGVDAYHFDNSCFGTVLGYVVQLPIEKFIADNEQQFNQSIKSGSSLRFWKGSSSEAANYFQLHSLQVFELASAIGLSGWVVAREFEALPLKA